MSVEISDILRMKRPLSIRSVNFSPALRVLALGPRPDDFDAISITMRFFKDNGNKVHVGVIRTSSGVEDSYLSTATSETKAALRDEEQRKSCRFFGLPDESLTFLDLERNEEVRLISTTSNLNRLRNFIRSCEPDLVFLPHGNDTNFCHRMINQMLARFNTEINGNILAFLNRDPKTVSMRDDCYTLFEEKTAKWKAELLRFHRSQHQRNLNARKHGFDDRILNINAEMAGELGKGIYAEMFEIKLFSHL